MTKRWQKTEISYLQRYAESKRLDELAQRFHTDVAAVRAKLAELGLAPRAGAAAGAPEEADPALASYEAALSALDRKDWPKALELFEKAIAESDQLDLAARASQYAKICRSRISQPSGEPGDLFLLAVVEKNRGQLAAALELCGSRDGLQKKDERFAYLAASIHALEGRFDEAAAGLGLAVEANPKNRIHAYHDRDFAEMRKRSTFAHLFGLD